MDFAQACFVGYMSGDEPGQDYHSPETWKLYFPLDKEH